MISDALGVLLTVSIAVNAVIILGRRQQTMTPIRDARLPGACFPVKLGVYWASFISAPPRSSWFAPQPPELSPK